MNSFSLKRTGKYLGGAIVAVLAIGLLVTLVSPVAADENPNPGVLPPHSKAFGKTYDEWNEEWHKWILEIPADDSPMFDEDGSNCALGQSGKVWFLTGAFGGEWERNCTIPAGKAIFFPVYNFIWFPFPQDDPFDLDLYGPWMAEAVDGLSGTATIDGDEIEDVADYRAQTTVFDAWMPDDNLIDFLAPDEWPAGTVSAEYPDGWPEGYSWDNYNDGVYLLLAPLSEGEHTINLTAGGGWLDVTYNITVEDE